MSEVPGPAAGENDPTGQEVMDAYTEAVGKDLLDYVLNLPGSSDDLQAELDDTRRETLRVLAGPVAQSVDLSLSTDIAPIFLRSHLLGPYPNPTGVSLARSLHVLNGGSEVPVTGDTELERAIAAVAREVYPTLLLTPLRPPSLGLPIEAASFLFHHPAELAFQTGALADEVFGKVFTVTEEPTGIAAWVWRSSGAGSTLQLVMLSSFILDAAWRRVKVAPGSDQALPREAIAQLRRLRKLLSGRPLKVDGLVALTGVLLPDGVTTVALSDASLEVVTPAIREHAPLGFDAKLSGTDSSGAATVINYEGDLVLHTTVPLRARIRAPMSLDDLELFPPDMREFPAVLDEPADRLRMALLLALSREPQPQIVSTWRYVDDPLGFGRATVWSDARQAVGLVPVRLTPAEVALWVEWYEALTAPRAKKIRLAISRVLQASSERRYPSDVLVDAVIAWENMFGSPQGEATLRITSSLAILLEADAGRRGELSKKLAEIYGLRSKIVHGSGTLRDEEIPLCQEALKVAVRAIGLLVRTRPDLLDLPSGKERSLDLLLG